MLPEGFVFSQSSLQDYSDCPRRFELRYLRRCRWPAPHTADALLWEQVTERGHAFHRLLRQLHTGIPEARLHDVASRDADLLRWWETYRECPPKDMPEEVRVAEATLSTTLAGFRLEARFDLLAGTQGGRWLILDWKTNARRPERRWLEGRQQSHVYPWVLVTAGDALNGGARIAPEQVEMCYWFAEFAAQPERFPYSSRDASSDEEHLSRLISEISTRAENGQPGRGQEDAFPRTLNQALCRFCCYRSLCWETVQAGLLAEAEAEAAEGELIDPPEVDLENLTPIPY
jgi:hypothetical protein